VRFVQLVGEGFDVVLFHGKCLAPLIEDFDALPVVVDFCDATSLRLRGSLRRAPWWRRPLLALRWLQVRRVERRLLRHRRQAFVSERDREAILGAEGGGRVVTIGVDHGFWRRQGPPGPDPRIVFSGIMSYAPNDDAARVLLERILPRVRAVVPDAQLQILGRDPTPELRKLAGRSPGIEVTGFVPDMRPHLERAWVEAVPLRYGAGVQNKIREAMAMELPVVTTPLARDGLRVETGEEPPVEVADGEREFAERVIKLLEQPGERARLAAAGRRYVERHFDWAGSAERLERLCVEAVEAAPSPRRKRT
jgi:glycosyltransferase involved in cell wall biosynthesis